MEVRQDEVLEASPKLDLDDYAILKASFTLAIFKSAKSEVEEGELLEPSLMSDLESSMSSKPIFNRFIEGCLK